MKRLGTSLLLLLFIVGVGLRLSRRWRDEHHNSTIAVVVDWGEVRALNARAATSESLLLDDLKSEGVTGLLMPAMTLDDLLSQERILPQCATPCASPFNTRTLFFKDRVLAMRVQDQLLWRGASTHVFLKATLKNIGATLQTERGTFDALKDIEVGFDPDLIQLLESKGLVPLLRMNTDPWITSADIRSMLTGDAPDRMLPHARGILFNSDAVPGGTQALPYWRAWLEASSVWIPLFEFHPAKSAWQLTMQLPGQCLKAHTIPSLELKDMQPADVLSRWNRAAVERSCRLFLVHASPNDSYPAFHDRLGELNTILVAHGWTVGWPEPSIFWKHPHPLLASVISLIAVALALFSPWWALQKGKEAGYGFSGFWITSLWTMLGASGVAALGWNAWTRTEIVPLRGIKVAFLLSWLGSALILYRQDELRALLKANVRRWDIVLGAIALAVVGYVMIRSGNASAAWKSPMEQKIRDLLEQGLIARPRFKEFAIGHPILLIGYWLERRRSRNLSDGRPWILIGMMGQASVVNTFCHLHSPIVLAYIRSGIGLAFGFILGAACIRFFQVSRQKIRRA